MARKKKIQIEQHPGVPRGAEHLRETQVNPALPTARLDSEGREILSDEPIVLHLKRRTVTDLETLRHTIQQLRAHDGPIEFETFAEADDFDLEDDYGQFASQWEIPTDHDNSGEPMPTAEEYIRWRQTGELPSRLFPQSPPSPPAAAPPSEPVQGSAPPANPRVNPAS